MRRQEPDRVPVDYWSTPEAEARLCAITGLADRAAIMDSFGVDFVYVEGPRYVGPPLGGDSPGETLDIWGVPRRTQVAGNGPAAQPYRTVTSHPLAGASTPEDVLDYGHWPDVDWFDFSVVREQCRAEADRCVMFMGDRLNRIAQLKPAMYLRGVKEVLLDMSLNPDLAEAVFSNIRRFYCSYAERIFDAARGKLDILLMGDDFGAQNGPLLSPDMWVDYLGKGFAAYIDIAKSYDLLVMHHTCGSVRALIPLMIERGLDILQSLQPEAAGMDPRELKAAFGGQLAFQGGISIQRTLPFGTPQQVRHEVREVIDALAPGGGYILCTSHNIQADTPMENLEALLRAYQDYGAYS